MPTYEYRCTACGEHAEIFHKISDAPKTKCPKCGAEALARGPGGGAGLHFKGSGFYITDYGRGGEGGGCKSSGSDGSCPCKPDKGSE